tara:strand:+ start:357 stop:590 length:234 start_codon:yes stop_codon:yes gene_type:complete
MYKVEGKEYDDWTEAQDEAVRLLEEGVEWVNIMIWSKEHNEWGLLQELNLEQGIMPTPNFSTATLAPYYVRLRNYEG